MVNPVYKIGCDVLLWWQEGISQKRVHVEWMREFVGLCGRWAIEGTMENGGGEDVGAQGVAKTIGT